jgi:PiT family inorganic phosphate transporter
MTIILTVIVIALTFEFINGFHDTANSIATVVSTKVLSPRQAVVLAACTNLAGALLGTAVAKTITGGLVDSGAVAITSKIIVCALLGAIGWDLITWWYGMPSSSSHALIGGLCGAALAAADNRWNVIIWSQPSQVHWFLSKGLLWKVIVPMFISPLLGFVCGYVLMGLLYLTLRHQRPVKVNKFFGIAQMFSAGGMGVMHGTNDAQKTMGIIALALLTATKAGTLDHLPGWLEFLRAPLPPPGKELDIATWIKVLCALVMASGTAVGGWRIIKTLGHRVVKLHPINGFAAETSSATVIGLASLLGIPVSTTHNISAAIMGVGCARRFNAIRWMVVEQMVWAWIFTIPATGAMGYGLVRLGQACGWIP